MSHAYHDKLPGFHADQLLHDGCPECEDRGQPDNVMGAMTSLDTLHFVRAWTRAGQWQLEGLPTLSRAERPMLEAIRGVQLCLERFGIPIGQLPEPRRSL